MENRGDASFSFRNTSLRHPQPVRSWTLRQRRGKHYVDISSFYQLRKVPMEYTMPPAKTKPKLKGDI